MLFLKYAFMKKTSYTAPAVEIIYVDSPEVLCLSGQLNEEYENGNTENWFK